MRKVLSIAILLLMTITASAQGAWISSEEEADELKGTKGGTICVFTEAGMGSFVVWDWNEPQIRLVSDSGIFNINNGGWLEILVGFYDDNGKMKDKMNLWLCKEDGSGYSYARTVNKGVIPPGQKKKVKKIFNALLSGTGFVRIVAPRYNKLDFDLKVAPYK
jgi:hypothetical protein